MMPGFARLTRKGTRVTATKSSLTILFLLLTLTTVHAQSSGAAAGRVKGTIVDSNGAVVAKVKVTFEAGGRKREAVTNEEGVYEIELPAGLYRMTTRATGFCASQRERLRVRQSSDRLLNLTLLVCPVTNVVKFDESGKYIGEECRTGPVESKRPRP